MDKRRDIGSPCSGQLGLHALGALGETPRNPPLTLTPPGGRAGGVNWLMTAFLHLHTHFRVMPAYLGPDYQGVGWAEQRRKLQVLKVVARCAQKSTYTAAGELKCSSRGCSTLFWCFLILFKGIRDDK